MHDLPPEVAALLARARSEQAVPDARVRERVKQGVAAAIVTGAVVSSAAHVSAHAAAKSWLAGSLAAKITGVALLGAVAAGTVVAPSVLAPRATPAAAHRTSRARGPSLPARPALSDTLPERPTSREMLPERPASRETPAESTRAAPPSDSLADELRLLDRASVALSRGDPTTARTLLEQHRAQFARPVMIEEREGLELIARCQLDRSSAQADARAFLARAARSVLSARVARACGRTR